MWVFWAQQQIFVTSLYHPLHLVWENFPSKLSIYQNDDNLDDFALAQGVVKVLTSGGKKLTIGKSDEEIFVQISKNRMKIFKDEVNFLVSNHELQSLATWLKPAVALRTYPSYISSFRMATAQQVLIYLDVKSSPKKLVKVCS